MRLLAVTNFPSARHANAAIFFRDTLVQVLALGHEVVVIAPRVWVPWPLRFVQRYAAYLKETPFEEQHGIPVHRPAYARPPGIWFLPREGRVMASAAGATAKALHREKPFDAIIGYGLMPYADCGWRVARTLGIPTASVAIGSDLNDFAERSDAMRGVAATVLHESDHVICNSGQLRDRALALGADPGRTTVYYKGIDLEPIQSRPDRTAARRTLDLPQDARILLYVGRLMRGKGVFELLDAFTRSLGERAEWHLVMVGEAIAADAIREQAAAANLTDRVHVRSMVPRSDIPAYLAAADMFALPSHAEGVSNAVLEAMAAGLPVICTSVGGMPEVIDHETTGLLVPPNDPAALAKALSRLADDPTLAEGLGQAAERAAAERFDTARNAARLVELLSSMR